MNHITPPPMYDEGSVSLSAFDIETQLRMYPYDSKRLDEVYKALDKEIQAFDPFKKNEEGGLPFGGSVVQSYGEYLEDHLIWTSETLRNFLMFMGYEEEIADKSAQHFKRHDIGKTLMPGQWKITEGKQNLTEEQRHQRTLMHCILGAQRIQQKVESIAHDRTDNEIMGYTVGKYMALFHHERLNGTGPFKRTGSDMCPILRAATIVDTFHGKLKAGKSHDQICEEMASDKHKGEFDLEILGKFATFLNNYAPAPRKDLVSGHKPLQF